MQLFERSVKVVEIVADRVIATNVKTDRLEVVSEFCVDGVCVNKDQLKAMLESAGGATSVPAPPTEETSTETSAKETSTTTEETITTEETSTPTDEATTEDTTTTTEEVMVEESTTEETASSTPSE